MKLLRRTAILLIFLAVIAAVAIIESDIRYKLDQGNIDIGSPETARLFVCSHETIDYYEELNPKNGQGAPFSAQEITDPELLDMVLSWCDDLPRAEVKHLRPGEGVMLGGWRLELYLVTDECFYLFVMSDNGDGTYDIDVSRRGSSWLFIKRKGWAGELTLTDEQGGRIFRRFTEDYDPVTDGGGEFIFIRDVYELYK